MSQPGTAEPAKEELDLCGRRVADFQVLRKLGQGGMGQVYLAEQVSLKRNVALKILRPELAASKSALARFQAEAEAVARITHPNIVQVYAFGTDGDMPYMALEYVEGRNLREFIHRKGPPELPVSLSIMRQVAAALQRASEAGIIHRDIKPENILLTRKGEVKVADFGLSRVLEGEKPALNLTQTGVTMGTPLYMSPEQVEGKPVDPRTDIYSFGVTCYHMLAGEPPFRGSTAFEVALQHVQKQPPPLDSIRPDLPAALCAIVHKMMAKDPADRYQTGREILRDVAKLRDGLSGVHPTGVLPAIQVESVTAVNGAASRHSQSKVLEIPRSRRGWRAALVGLTLVVAAAGGAGLAWWRGYLERQAAAHIPPGDAQAVDLVPRPSKLEHTLKESADLYLESPPGRGIDLNAGTGACMNLGLFYLDAGRYEEAIALFKRMEKLKEPQAYQTLGLFGRAVALALMNRAKESNDLLIAVFRNPGKGGFPKEKPRFDAKKSAPVLLLLNNSPRWHAHATRARWANNRNGIADQSVPKLYADRVPLRNLEGGK